MQISTEDPKITFASCLSLKCRRKGTKKRKKTASFVASLRWRTAAIERTTCDLSCLLAIRDNLLLCLWPYKRKPRHCGESTGKTDQDSVTKYHQFRSVVVDSQILQLLISRECFSGEAEREWWEAEVTSALHCVLWETKHPSARSPQWKSEPSNSFSPQQCKWWSWVLFDKEAGSPGNSIALLKFQAQLMMLLCWGIFVAILIREENKSSIFHPRSRMSWLTAEEKPLLWLALVGAKVP